jgi:hypothetical protein
MKRSPPKRRMNGNNGGRQMGLYRIVNVPEASNKDVDLVVSIDGSNVYVKAVDKRSEFNSSGVCDLFIGEHLFEPDKHDWLRKMVGDAIVTAILQARDIGYRQAQDDIRRAIGISR